MVIVFMGISESEDLRTHFWCNCIKDVYFKKSFHFITAFDNNKFVKLYCHSYEKCILQYKGLRQIHVTVLLRVKLNFFWGVANSAGKLGQLTTRMTSSSSYGTMVVLRRPRRPLSLWHPREGDGEDNSHPPSSVILIVLISGGISNAHFFYVATSHGRSLLNLHALTPLAHTSSFLNHYKSIHT